MLNSSETTTIRSGGGVSASIPATSRLGVAGSASPPGCMVVGADGARRELLGGAARGAGWAVLDCDDVKSARIQLLKNPQAMVVFDLESDGGAAPEMLKGLAQRVSKQKNALVVMCGNEGNAIEEIWARQLGVWLYLPGVVDDTDLSSLFKEAGTITARRTATAERDAYFPGHHAATA
jgi:DNA-binding NtrC family response regulator